MIQLQILSGKQAGRELVVRSFPFLIGRSAESTLPLDEAGVWDRHLQIQFEPGTGYTCAVQAGAPTRINGEAVEQGRLRPGDLLELGAAQLRFWLAPGPQKSLRWRESLTWAVLLALFAVQAALIWRLMH